MRGTDLPITGLLVGGPRTHQAVLVEAIPRRAYRRDSSWSESYKLRQKLFAIITTLGLSLLAIAVHAQESGAAALELNVGTGPPIKLLRVDHDTVDISIDGRIDEKIWQGIEPIGEMRVTKPDTLAKVPYETDIRMFYTERGIYVSFDMEQPQDSIIERFVARDEFHVSRDRVDFTLDTSGDGRYGYWMGLSLGDSQMDGTILPERQFAASWDGAWYGATGRSDRGWVAEFYVPWSQMAMPKAAGGRRIGLKTSRWVAHLNEDWAWPWLTETQARFISRFQPLELEDVNPRQNWSVFPYVSGTVDSVTDEKHYKAGMDLFWRPSTNFQLTGTVNPDFGSVEADNVVVNLTADETFFPEKRLFFQEGQEIFNLTGRRQPFGQQPVSVLNTRRIGGRPRDVALPAGVELPTREEIKTADIVAAAKATGQFGSFRYGILAAVEDGTNYVADDNLRYTQEGRDFGAFRVLYEDSKGAAYRGLGWITTIVAHPEADAVVHGSDFHYLTTSGKWNINGQLLFSDRDETGTGTGGTADIKFTQRQGLQYTLKIAVLDDTIDVNDLGFQTRNDVTDIQFKTDWNRSGLTRVRNFRLSPFARYEENGDGYRTNSAVGVEGELTFNNLSRINGFCAYLPQRYDDRNSFGNGTFEVQDRARGEIDFNTDESRAVSLSGKLAYAGEFVYGASVDSQVGINWHPRGNLGMSLSVLHSDKDGWLLHQEDQNFTAFKGAQWQPQFSLEYFPSAKQQLRVSMQWIGIRAIENRFYTLAAGDTTLVEGPKPPGASDDFAISQLNFQLRYRWQIAPLSDLFVVYTRGDKKQVGLQEFDELFRDSWNDPLGDQLVVKLRYRFGS